MSDVVEYLAQYDYTINYIKGEDNIVADALSCFPESEKEVVVRPIMTINTDEEVMWSIKEGYLINSYTKKILENRENGMTLLEVESKNRLLYVGEHLIIPEYKDLHKNLFRVVHDKLGHFGADKTYALLRHSYYWPNIYHDLIKGYISSCQECQCNKSSTSKSVGLLYLLPIPEYCFGFVTLNFVSPLSMDKGFNEFCFMMCWVGADIQISPCRTTQMGEEFTQFFFLWLVLQK